MEGRHGIHFEPNIEPFFPVQLVETARRNGQPQLDDAGPQVVVQVDDAIVPLGSELTNEVIQVSIQVDSFVDMGIGFDEGLKGSLGAIVDFGTRNLLFQATYNRRRQHDVADGRKPDNQELGRGGMHCRQIYDMAGRYLKERCKTCVIADL